MKKSQIIERFLVALLIALLIALSLAALWLVANAPETYSSSHAVYQGF